MWDKLLDKLIEIEKISCNDTIPNFSLIRPLMYNLFVIETGPACMIINHYYTNSVNKDTIFFNDIADQVKWCVKNLPYFSKQAKRLRVIRNKLCHNSPLLFMDFKDVVIGLIELENSQHSTTALINELLEKLYNICDAIILGENCDYDVSICPLCRTTLSDTKTPKDDTAIQQTIISAYNSGAIHSLISTGNSLIEIGIQSLNKNANSELLSPHDLLYNDSIGKSLMEIGSTLVNTGNNLKHQNSVNISLANDNTVLDNIVNNTCSASTDIVLPNTCSTSTDIVLPNTCSTSTDIVLPNTCSTSTDIVLPNTCSTSTDIVPLSDTSIPKDIIIIIDDLEKENNIETHTELVEAKNDTIINQISRKKEIEYRKEESQKSIDKFLDKYRTKNSILTKFPIDQKIPNDLVIEHQQNIIELHPIEQKKMEEFLSLNQQRKLEELRILEHQRLSNLHTKHQCQIKEKLEIKEMCTKEQLRIQKDILIKENYLKEEIKLKDKRLKEEAMLKEIRLKHELRLQENIRIEEETRKKEEQRLQEEIKLKDAISRRNIDRLFSEFRKKYSEYQNNIPVEAKEQDSNKRKRDSPEKDSNKRKRDSPEKDSNKRKRDSPEKDSNKDNIVFPKGDRTLAYFKKEDYRSLMKDKKVMVTSGRYKGREGKFVAWNGTVCRIQFPIIGIKSVSNVSYVKLID